MNAIKEVFVHPTAEVDPGAGVVPTALALSPAFADDGLIFLGAAGGRVHPLRWMDLPVR